MHGRRRTSGGSTISIRPSTREGDYPPAGNDVGELNVREMASAQPVYSRSFDQFMASYPLLTLDLMTSNYREEMMIGADVAVRFGAPDAPSLITRKLMETRVLTCASPGYLSQHGEPRTPHDLAHHECIMFRDPQTGRPFPWEFHRGIEVLHAPAAGRVVMDDPSAAVAACAAGQGIFQSFEMGLDPWRVSGELVQILPEWADERYPLYAYHPSRHLPPAKVRAFVDLILEITRGPLSGRRESVMPLQS